MPVAAGTKLGPYEILSALGAGGMGEVYKARDTRLERTVAIKVLPAQFSANADLKQRFEREARAISSLNHPNICTLHDVGNEGGTDYLVLEFIEGETLAQRLGKGALPVKDVLRLGSEIADALDRAHRAGIVHRDLKPGNVMLTKSGAKLLDFGLAKPQAGMMAASATHGALTQTDATSPITQQGTLVGTFQYMSPEQVEGKEADARSDIFAFGAVLYEMATGKRAFEGKSQISVASAILEKEPEPISAVQPMSPAALDYVVRTCLAKDPEERFQTAHDIKLQLKWISDAGSVAGVPAGVRARRLASRRLLTGAALIGWVAAAGIAILAVMLSRDVREAHRPLTAEFNPPAGVDFAGVLVGPPAISPDGRKIAFSAGDGKGSRLWVRDIGSGRAEALDGTEGAIFPFWSPDSSTLGFFANGKLRRVAAGGGPVQIVCDAPEGRGGSWNTSGTIIFTPNITEPLYRVAEGGGTPEKLTDAKPGWTHRNPYFLPDGEHFLYIAREPTGEATAGGLYAGSLKGGEPKLLLDRASNVQYSDGYLLYFKDANLLAQRFDASALKLTGDPIAVAQRLEYWNPRDAAYFAASPGGVLVYRNAVLTPVEPVWVDREGREIAKAGAAGSFASPVLSPDGSKLALSRIDKDSLQYDVWVTDLEHNSSSRATFANSTFQLSYAFSPDGNFLAASAMTGGSHGQLWIQSVSGSGAREKVAETAVWMSVTDWSRDGRYLIGDVQEDKTREDVFFVDLKGDRKLTKFLQTPASEQGAKLSPNGKWLAYLSDESGRFELYVTAFPGPGGKWQISSTGTTPGSYPQWSRDGKELYFVSQNKLMAAPITDAASFQFGTPQALPMATEDLSGFAPGPMADRFLVLRRAGALEPSPMHVVLNWTEELKK